MATGILHLHLLLALIFVIALWKSTGPWARIAAAVGVMLVLTGAHNFMTRMTSPPPGWHAAIGIKILLGLHAITMAFLLARGNVDPARFARWRRGAAISSAIAILIGLYYSNIARG